MAKKFLAYFVALTQILSFFAEPAAVYAEGRDDIASNDTGAVSQSSINTYENLTYEINSGEVTVTGYIGTETSITIPDSIDGNPVKIIGEGAFLNYRNLEKIVLSNSIRQIEPYAFYGCENLKNVTLPEGLSCISDFLFYGCSSLTGINLPNGITSIGESAFCECSKLDNVVIPNSVKYLKVNSFWKCTGLTHITVPSSVTQFGKFVFRDCTGLKTAGPIGGGYNYEFGWTDCIPSRAFHFLKGLTSLTIPSGIESVGHYSVDTCTNLNHVTLPASVQSLGDCAFGHNYSMSTFRFLGDCPDMGLMTCFSGNPPMTVYYPEGNSTWTSSTKQDYGSSWANWTPEAHSEDRVLAEDIITKSRYDISIGESIGLKYTLLPEGYTFSDEIVSFSIIDGGDCVTVNEIGVVTGVTDGIAKIRVTISNGSYADCVVAVGEYSEIKAYDNLKYSIVNNQIIITGCNRNATEVTIPETINNLPVTGIADEAFFYCNKIKSISIPSSVLSIGMYAFYFCDGLTSVDIPEGTEIIMTSAFEGCHSLRSVSLPKSLKIIEGYAFQGDTSLDSIILHEGLEEIGGYAFDRCAFSHISIPSTVNFISQYAFNGCAGLKSAGSLNSGKNYEFAWSKRIPVYAFHNCTSMTEIVISEGIEWIDHLAFANCSRLTSVTFPGSVNRIGSCEFSSCSSLSEIYFTGNYPEGIRSDAFEGLGSVTCYYPRSNSTWTESVRTNYGAANVTWVQWNPYTDQEESMYLDAASDHAAVGDIIRLYGVYTGSYPDDFELLIDDETAFELIDLTAVPSYSDHEYDVTVTLKALKVGEYTITLKNGELSASVSISVSEKTDGPAISDYLVKNNEKFQYLSELEGKQKEYTFDYNESWFFGDSKKYNNDLAIMSLKMAMATSPDDDQHKNSANIVNLYKKLGFEDRLIEATYPNVHPDSIAYTIGLKNIRYNGKVISLIAVAVRGGGYGEEWVGNFNVGEKHDGTLRVNKNHYGFELAADQVLKGLSEYLAVYKEFIGGEVKVWLTGFSRAAATTNMVAAKLIDGYHSTLAASQSVFDEISTEDIFAYGFECPQNTQNTLFNSPHQSKYDSIFAIVNPIDMIPKMAMTYWKYTRYGKTLYFQNQLSSNRYFSDYRPEMVKHYDNILNIIGNGTGVDADILAAEKIGQSVMLDELVTYIAKLAVDPYFFTLLHQDDVKKIVRQTLAEMTTPGFTKSLIFEIVKLLYPKSLFDIAAFPAAVADGLALFEDIVNLQGRPKNIVFMAHYPEMSLAWLETLRDHPSWIKASGDAAIQEVSEETVTENSFADPTNRKVIINGKADVDVYNSDGLLVGQFADGKSVEIENGVFCFEDLDKQTAVFLPNDEEYRVTVHSKADQELSYSCVEQNYMDGTATKVVSYQNIGVNNGDTLEGRVEDISVTDQAEYNLTVNEEQIEPTIDHEDVDTIQKYTVSYIVEGEGEVFGGGEYLPGEYACLSVIDNVEGFIGWYVKDTLVSEEAEYRFCVTENTEVTAKFDATQSSVMTLNDDSLVLMPSEKKTLIAQINPEDSTQEISWSSSNESVVTVDNEENVTGIKPGSATITATTSNGLTATCIIRVLFTDVADSKQYFYNPVYWALDNEITVGAGGPGKFSPSGSCTREQFVTFLWRQQGKPSYEKGCDFTDVPKDAWYYEPISWAAENGITTGLNDGTGRFGVGQACTREQCVTFLHRAADTPEPEGSIEFTDSQEGRYYYKAIKWAAGKGITVGLNDGTGRFGVGQKCTRGMLVTFLYRYDQSE